MSTFNREELLGTLNECRPGLANGGMIDELTHLWFDRKNVYAYNGGLGIRRRIETDLACGLPGKPLLDLLASSRLEKCSITKAPGGIDLKLARSPILLAGIDDADRRVWPFPKVLPKEDGLLLSDKLFEAMKMMTFAKASSPSQSIHHGVLLSVGHDVVTIYATDGKSIASIGVKAKNVSMDKFLLPWEMLSVSAALLKGKDDAQLWLLEDCVVAGAPGTMIASNLVDLTGSPDVVGIMKTRFGGKMQELPKGFGPVLDRAVILAGKDEPLLTLTTSKGRLRLQGKYALGQIDEELDLEGGGAAVKAKFPADLIAQAVPLSDRFNLTSSTLNLAGPNSFQYVLAAKEK
jgi:DNA polymerase III sliding clamp (beta) subunit (PCNA family)